MGDREFDVVVFGATGFTGAFVVEEMAISVEMDSLYKSNNVKWAIAGRSHDKLKQVLKNVAKKTGHDWLNNVPIILADIGHDASMVEMAKRARVLISVVGPYRFYGEPVVKACLEAATNYVDISGEPQFLEAIQLKYNDLAKQKGIHIVGAVGWDSIPADMGLAWTKQQFKGDLNHVDIIIRVGGGPDHKIVNYGTWCSVIYGFAYAYEVKDLRKQLIESNAQLRQPPTKPKYKLPTRRPMSYVEEVDGYILPFPGSDKSVVRRSENFMYNVYKERPVQVETYFRVPTWFDCFLVLIASIMFASLAKFSMGRKILKRYPEFFSLGLMTRTDIPLETLKQTSFSHTFVAHGWDHKLDDIDAQHETPPNKKIVTRVSGPDPGYTATSRFCVHSAMTMIFDQKHMPGPGVLSPAACFGKTYLIDRLTKRNIKFEVIEQS